VVNEQEWSRREARGGAFENRHLKQENPERKKKPCWWADRGRASSFPDHDDARRKKGSHLLPGRGGCSGKAETAGADVEGEENDREKGKRASQESRELKVERGEKRSREIWPKPPKGPLPKKMKKKKKDEKMASPAREKIVLVGRSQLATRWRGEANAPSAQDHNAPGEGSKPLMRSKRIEEGSYKQ